MTDTNNNHRDASRAATSGAYADSKPHYELLDGLRGVAALLVLWYHVHEGFAFAGGQPVVNDINHGYLAVDFFFMLSGFVIGYAYDDRWGRGLTTGRFFRRRLIRLHPMVIMGAVIGLVCFLFQGAQQWDGTPATAGGIMTALLCAMLFIPAMPGGFYEVRGNGEAFPLNGPAWSLFFEYIGNIIYALLIRRLHTATVAVMTALLGVGLTAFTWLNLSGYDMLGVGWTMGEYGLLTGGLRMLFPFTAGIMISRIFTPCRVRGAFWLCAVILLLLFSIPYIPSDGSISLNGVYESFCIVLVFPVLVWLGASGTTTDGLSSGVCKFLGDISFPLYITHYPVMYLFYAWMIHTGKHTMGETWPAALGVMALNVAVAYACLRLYDEPVRKWLARRFTAAGRRRPQS